ncbi:hypothetical protein MKX03_000396 [Papaver bracteatum]|nr:hypothetical protein MKX03_000396 [Papaver bracteatum]
MTSVYIFLCVFLISFLLDDHQVQGLKVFKNESSVCNLYEGTWVHDTSYPLYNASNCPFVEREFNCIHNGRPDKLYLQYRWKPAGCETPRFDGHEFLTRFKGKKFMFVGDSLSLNQWQSLTCMLHSAVPKAQYTLTRAGGLSTFKFLEYDLSIMFSRNAFLVDIVGEKIGRVLKLYSIEGGKLWSGVDTLIFNTWHWWLHVGRKQPWDVIQEGTKIYKDMDRLVAFRKALSTWAKWVNTHVDPRKTQVFFQGISPDHSNSTDWGDASGKNCFEEKKPLFGSIYPIGEHPAQMVLKDVLNLEAKTVKLLDVTFLSQLRKDAHPSVYGIGGHRASDCSHWCLAGVPDTWNQLLYASLVKYCPNVGC